MVASTPLSAKNNGYPVEENMNAKQENADFLEKTHKKQKKKIPHALIHEGSNYFLLLEKNFLPKLGGEQSAGEQEKISIQDKGEQPGEKKVGKMALNTRVSTHPPQSQPAVKQQKANISEQPVAAVFVQSINQRATEKALPSPFVNVKKDNDADYPVKEKKVLLTTLLSGDKSGNKEPHYQIAEAEQEKVLQNKLTQHLFQEKAMVLGHRTAPALKIHYQFQRWSGDHSVKVSLEGNSHHQINVSPSDTRTATLLESHKALLSKYELTFQQQDDEQQRKQQDDPQPDADEEWE